MERILSDLLSGKMNIRKWIVLGFVVAFMTIAFVVALAVGRAVIVVSNYAAEHPEAVLGVAHGYHD